MQPSVAQNEQSIATDIATTIARTMRQMGVVGLPRNYEIFYEAMTGSNPELSLEFVALSKRPTQAELDRIGRKYFAQSHGQGIVENARDVIARELEQVARLLRNGQSHIQKYGRILHETSSGLENRTAMSRELLQKIVGVVTTATTSTIERGQEVARTLGEKTAELENVKSKLEEYKRLADTDPLTHLWNRRAFDKEIARLYNDKKHIAFGALVLADIDSFKEVNDRFGHPVGDKIIQIVASIFKSTVCDDMFVARTGGEEFAIIVAGSGEDKAGKIAERVRVAVEQTVFANKQSGVNYGPVTISMGVCMAADAEGPDDLYAKADRALYASKMAGRNRVTKFSAIPEQRTGKNWLIYKTD
ncbi:MAG TPA: GGDEF domain-containing protein [Rhizobiaceae bacterium]|nr:GGDEF domain-containing protein [Rhizobiaceae bacterium]